MQTLLGDRKIMTDSRRKENKQLHSIREIINRLQHKLQSCIFLIYLSIFVDYVTTLFPSMESVTFRKLNRTPSHLRGPHC
jgi:hypothetical protein